MKSYFINSMPDGAVVNPVNLVGIMKNLKVIRVTESSVLVDGWKKEDADTGWEHFRGYISTSVRVTMAEDEPEEITPGKVARVPGGKRGRQKSAPIEIDYPEKFTMNELAADYPEVGKPRLYLMVQEEVKGGKIKRIGEIKNLRGKNTIIYGKQND